MLGGPSVAHVLRQESGVVKGELLQAKGLLQGGDLLLMLRPVDQVMDILVVRLVIKELVRITGKKEPALDRRRFPFLIVSFPCLHGLYFPLVPEYLSVGNIGIVILDIRVGLVTNRAGHVQALIRPPAVGEMVSGFGLGILSQENRPLVRRGNLGTGQGQPGLGHVHERDEPVHRAAGGFSGPEVFEPFRDPDDQRAMRSGIVQEALGAWQHTAMVGIVDDDGVFVAADPFEPGNVLTDPLVHDGDRVRVTGVALTDAG